MKKTKHASLPEPDLETALTEINHLISQMEQSDVSLEQSLTLFERGVTLIKHAQTLLKNAEQKVQILTQEPHGDVLSPYENKDE